MPLFLQNPGKKGAETQRFCYIAPFTSVEKPLEMLLELAKKAGVKIGYISTICCRRTWQKADRKRLLGPISERLRLLLRAAETIKFINLDMEEYRDLHFTVDLFCRFLDEKEFLKYSAAKRSCLSCSISFVFAGINRHMPTHPVKHLCGSATLR